MIAESIHTSYITTRKTYLLICSACGEGREIHSTEIAPRSAPYTYHCPCGYVSHIRLVSLLR